MTIVCEWCHYHVISVTYLIISVKNIVGRNAYYWLICYPIIIVQWYGGLYRTDGMCMYCPILHAISRIRNGGIFATLDQKGMSKPC